MRSSALALALWALLSVATIAQQVEVYASQNVTPSVQRLLVEGGFCTAFSIHSKGYWMTAAHCVATAIKDLGGQPAKVVKADKELDLAILEGKKAPALRFAAFTPKTGDQTMSLGYPRGIADLLPFFGHVMIPSLVITEIGKSPKLVVHEGGGQGMSGGPILIDGEVVSVIQSGADFPSHVIIGSTLADTKRFAKGYAK